MKYIQGDTSMDGCPFCTALAAEDPAEHNLVHRGKTAFVILNRYPYTTGHLLVLPLEHKELLNDLDGKTRAEMMELVNHCLEVLEEAYHPQGFNIGMNMGEAAGAGIPKHLHWHIVPRWVGDTNYMSTVGGTRVLPETLEDTYQKVLDLW
jgi:ATP adenylyltransferase